MADTPAIDLAAMIESVWVVEATYAPDAFELRTPFRAEHVGRIAALKREGVLVEAGGYLDGSTALLFVRADSEEAALDIVRADVYLREGIWVELRARPFGRVR